MKHFPRPDRGPVSFDGLTITRAPWYASRLTRWLAAAVIFATGFFLGAIAFGEVLVRSTDLQSRTTERSYTR